MNEKEAREIWELHNRPTPDCNCGNGDGPSCFEAKGYLEAIEKARVLVDCLKRIERQYRGYTGEIDPDIENTLAKWEKKK